jgi:hypothetical protein
MGAILGGAKAAKGVAKARAEKARAVRGTELFGCRPQDCYKTSNTAQCAVLERKTVYSEV